ncbi:MAG: deoxyguanosinetriphosphate triphosphohydrolase [Nocardioidaceae bacterium]
MDGSAATVRSTAAYDAHDAERFLAQPSRSGRSPFERDRARIVHSAALRRLAAKTQVVGPSSHDFIRNRLTHTLEVAQVGRGLAMVLGCDPELVEAACLAHDLGHPPFGHNGEQALNETAAGIGGFEGNAQTLRLLTRLEPKIFSADGRSLGLNLTRAVLDASTKYPWTLGNAPAPAGRHGDGLPRSVHKFGVYSDDLPVFDWMRSGVEPGRTCVEAQLMDFADDVAYSVHDLEDGVVAGRIDLTSLDDPQLRERVWATVRDWYAPQLSSERLEDAYRRLTKLAAWPQTSYDGSRRHLAGLKNLTSRLINRFCHAVQDAVQGSQLPPVLIRYAGVIPVSATVTEEIVVLKGVAAQLVMKAEGRVAAMAAQRDLLRELVEAMWRHGAASLDPMFAADFKTATDDHARLRVVVDQAASLTDLSAVDRHRALVKPQ